MPDKFDAIVIGSGFGGAGTACRLAEKGRRVLGNPNQFVVDGAIVPTSIGRNPSHTIAALAERIGAHIT
jgi:choline dehydrogenase-like flavoprotein